MRYPSGIKKGAQFIFESGKERLISNPYLSKFSLKFSLKNSCKKKQLTVIKFRIKMMSYYKLMFQLCLEENRVEEKPGSH